MTAIRSSDRPPADVDIWTPGHAPAVIKTGKVLEVIAVRRGRDCLVEFKQHADSTEELAAALWGIKSACEETLAEIQRQRQVQA